MYRSFFLVLIIIFSACSSRAIKPYDKEDYYIAVANDSFQRADFNASSTSYYHLYKKTNNEEYLTSYYNSLYYWQKFKLLEQKTKFFLDKDIAKLASMRYLTLSYYHQRRLDDAIKEGLKVMELAKDKLARDYIVLADSYLLKQDYKRATIYYKSAYANAPSDTIVDKLAYMLFSLGKKQEAIGYLETHLKLYGFNLYIGKLLSDYYLKMGNVSSIIGVYEKIYEHNQDKALATKIIELYFLRKDYDGLATFLEKTSTNNKLLFEIYRMRKNSQKAARLAYLLYEQTMDVNYLAQNAMIEYEKGKKTKKLIHDTIKKLSKVVDANTNPIYLNYLGYILIDHDINIDKGITLVKKALLNDEDNFFYIDSLAWGKYKLGKLKEALLLIEKIKHAAKKDEMIAKHYEIIKNECKIKHCLKE